MNAGWLADPTGRHQLRYHDGTTWTDHVSDNGVAGTDPIASNAPLLPPPPTTQPAPAAPLTQPVPHPLVGAPRQKKPIWKRWWFIALGVLIVLGIVSAALSDSGDEDADANQTDEAVPGDEVEAGADDQTDDHTDQSDSGGETAGEGAGNSSEIDDAAEPGDGETAGEGADNSGENDDAGESGHPDADDGPVPVGTAVMEDDDLVRVNSLTPNAPTNEFFTPDPGFSVTVAEVEACAGDDGFNANALYWTAFLGDNTTADNFLFADDYPTVGLGAGACVRGNVSFEVPDGSAVASIVLTGPLFDETARWQAEGAVPVTERLQPVTPVAASPVGETISFGSGHTAVVRSVTDATPPMSDFFEPEAGQQFAQVDVELCAGDESLPVNPLYWISFNTEHWAGGAELGGSTLSAIDVAPGQCVAGIVEVTLPEGSTTAYVVLQNAGLDEVARWTTG